MSQTLLNTPALDTYDLTSEVSVLAYTQASAHSVPCQVKLAIGDDDNPLDGTGGEFTVTVTVDDVDLYGYPKTLTLAAAVTKVVWQSDEFTVDEGAEIAVTLESPNAADDDVAVTGYLYGTDVSETYESLTEHGASAVKIINMAVGLLAELAEHRRLTAFTRAAAGDSTILHAALDFYEESKLELLSLRKWHCARKLKALTVSDDDPVLSGKWTYKYARPADCLILHKITDVNDTDDIAWDRMAEERTGTVYTDDWILTNHADAYAVYTFNVGEERYLPGMATLHSLLLMRMLAMTITSKERSKIIALQEFEQRKNELIGQAVSEGYVANEKGKRDYTGLY